MVRVLRIFVFPLGGMSQDDRKDLLPVSHASHSLFGGRARACIALVPYQVLTLPKH